MVVLLLFISLRRSLRLATCLPSTALIKLVITALLLLSISKSRLNLACSFARLRSLKYLKTNLLVKTAGTAPLICRVSEKEKGEDGFGVSRGGLSRFKYFFNLGIGSSLKSEKTYVHPTNECHTCSRNSIYGWERFKHTSRLCRCSDRSYFGRRVLVVQFFRVFIS